MTPEQETLLEVLAAAYLNDHEPTASRPLLSDIKTARDAHLAEKSRRPE